jgi:hypothetical protein
MQPNDMSLRFFRFVQPHPVNSNVCVLKGLPAIKALFLRNKGKFGVVGVKVWLKPKLAAITVQPNNTHFVSTSI